MPKNNAKKWAVIAIVLAAVGVVMTVLGFILDDMDYYWMIFVGLILGITFFICFFIFLAQAKRLERMFTQEELLAHWSFDVSEHFQKAEEEYHARKRSNRMLLSIVIAFFVLFTAIFTVLGFDDVTDASTFLLIMAGTLALICAVALLAPGMAYRRMKQSLPEVYVGPFGAWIMGEYVQWKAPMTRFNSVTFERGKSGVVISVSYDIFQRFGYQNHICRIPVPADREQEARKVAQDIAVFSNVAFFEA